MTADATSLEIADHGHVVAPEWLGIEQHADDRFSFLLTSRLVRIDGRLFGGTGLAAAVAIIEAATGRPPLWSTVQFVSSARVGERFDCHIEVLANGHRTSQVRMNAFVSDRLVFTALGATGDSRNGGLSAQLSTMPEVSAPEESPPFDLGFDMPPPDDPNQGPFGSAEYRQALGPAPDRHVWARLLDASASRASISYLADFVPNAVLRAMGRTGGGTSLDNTIRFGPEIAADTEWVLIDNDPYFTDQGYVHGAARVWVPDGAQVAVASQSAAAFLID